MIISGISNPSSQNASQAERQTNTQTTTENRIQAGTDKGPISATDREAAQTTNPKVENSSVNLSPTAVKLQNQGGSTPMPATVNLPEVISAPVTPSAEDATEKDETAQSASAKSFAYGALGMDHPDKVEEKEDDSYTAGQYLKAAATIGSMIALFV